MSFRPSRQRPSWHAVAALLAAVACAVGLGVAAQLQTQENADQTQKNASLAKRLARDERSSIDACNRQNQQTIQANRQSLALYGILKLTLTLNQLQISSGQVPQQLRGYITPTLETLRRGIASTAWTPPTPCTKVVESQGLHYQLPAAVPFSERLPPPTALTFHRS